MGDLSDRDLKSLLNNVYRGEKHVDVKTLQFSSAENMVDVISNQYARGFSEGFSQGPLLEEWRGTLGTRLQGMLWAHPLQKTQTQFWDLGCGTGENLLKAFLTNKSLAAEWIGVERMPDRYRMAADALDSLLEQAGKPDRIGRALSERLGLNACDGRALQSAGDFSNPLPDFGQKAKCVGNSPASRICVVEGDIMNIRDFSHARVVFLNIDDPFQMVTHQVLTGGLGSNALPNTALLVSYPLTDSDRDNWETQEENFAVVQDWSGEAKDNAKWLHSLYRRAVPRS